MINNVTTNYYNNNFITNNNYHGTSFATDPSAAVPEMTPTHPSVDANTTATPEVGTTMPAQTLHSCFLSKNNTLKNSSSVTILSSYVQEAFFNRTVDEGATHAHTRTDTVGPTLCTRYNATLTPPSSPPSVLFLSVLHA
jgi:hypothetical protein